MWFTGVQLIKEAPLTGHGLGSYPIVSANKFKDQTMCSIACVHPHNQFIFYAIELGSIGLILFLGFIASSFKRSANPLDSRHVSSAALLVLIISSMADATMWYRGFIYLFIPLLALNVATRLKNHEKI
jgi:O-antigen ligase